MLASLRKEAIKEEVALNVTNADQTVKNIETKVVKNSTEVEDGREGHAAKLDSELPTQKAVEKAVAEDEGPIVPADKDGVSKNGGEDDKLMTADGVEAVRKKEDNAMKDVINVASRKVEESAEVQNELLTQLKEAKEREESYKQKIEEINKLCEQALIAQRAQLAEAHGAEMNAFFEAVVAKGEALEAELNEAIAKRERSCEAAKKLYESSLKMNKMLLAAVKQAQPEKQLTRYVTPARRALGAY